MKRKRNNQDGTKQSGTLPAFMIMGGLLSITAVSGAVLSSTIVSADESVDTLTVTVDSACTMTATGGNTYTDEISPGTSSEIAGSTLTTVCNDAEGYSLYAIGYSGDSYDTATNTKMLGSGSALNNNIPTATSGSNSYWAMKLSSVTGVTPPTILNSFDDYHVIPEDYTQIAKYTSSTASSTAEGAAVNTNYKVNISSSQTAGTYTGKVKYVMVHPNTAPAPSTATTFDDAYASAGKTKLNGYYKMQDMTGSICSSVDDLQAGTLIDTRDNNTYTVAKIAGACWMTQNLRITGTVPAEGSNFTGADVNISECDLDSTVGECTGASDRWSFDIPMTHDSGNTTNGVWYNYAAASAKTIVGSNNTTIDTENICPENWTLPSYDTNKPAGSINSLTGSDSPTITAFTPVAGGYYRNGSPYDTSSGCWWSTVAVNISHRYFLNWYGSSLSTSNNYRYNGYYIRCMRAS